MKTKFLQFLIFTATFLFASPFVINAQNDQVFTLTADTLANGKTAELNEAGWKYHTGDDVNWAKPKFDDANWEALKNPALTRESLPQTVWNGIGWFRLRLNVAPALVNVPLNLEVAHLGASEIYLDGKLIKRYGTVGQTIETESSYNPNGDALGVVFDNAGEHTLAVRYSNQSAANVDAGYGKWLINAGGRRIGFNFQFKIFDDTANKNWSRDLQFNYIIVQAGIYFSFFILHLLLFALYPRERGNLFYSIFLLFVAANDLLYSVSITTHYGTVGFYWIIHWNSFFHSLGLIILPVFTYITFYGRIPRYLWYLVLSVVLENLLNFTLVQPTLYNWLHNLNNVVAIVLMTIVIIRAIHRRADSAWIVGIGVFLSGLIFVNDLASNYYGELSPITLITLDAIGSYSIMLSISIYLARQFARTNQSLEAKLVEVEQLSAKELEQTRLANDLALEREQEKARFAIVEAENERQAKELEEARLLQLSMLPKSLPQIEGLEIAAYMKPATEVGGDYYDFHIADDGTLTVAVGDATGHGLKAGTVVTATKSLFNNLAEAFDIPDTMRQISRSLKAMNLRGLFMALTLIKLKDKTLSICAAGMPSTLVYRAADQTVEEISLRALPLGSLANFNYQKQEISLQTGDCVVVMSDGFPEMFNAGNEMLGFDKAAEVLGEIADHSSQEIIDRFVEVSQNWAGTRPADDDVTFVVLKML